MQKQRFPSAHRGFLGREAYMVTKSVFPPGRMNKDALVSLALRSPKKAPHHSQGAN